MPPSPSTETPRYPAETRVPPQRKKRGWVRVLVVLVLLALVGAIVWRASTARKQADASANAKQAALASRPIPVGVVTVAQRTMPIYLVGLGTVTPYYSVTLKARVTGELMAVNFKEGQEVKQGQELMTIDPRPYQASLDQARGQLARDQAQLRNNQSEYQRYKALFDQGIVSKEQVDAQQSNYGQFEGAIKADQAAIETAALNVQYCHITSPITGRVGLRLVDPGNVITANTTNLVVINQFKPIAVDFTLPESQLPRVLSKLHADRRMQAEAFNQEDTQHLESGSLLTADNQIDVTTGTDKLKAVFPNLDEQLFPNQFVNVHLILEQRPNALTVPAAALQHGNDGDYVWTVQPDKTVQMRPVTVDATEGATIILQSGLQKGDMVVTDGTDKLRPGSSVQPRPAAGPAGGQGQPGANANQSGANQANPYEPGPTQAGRRQGGPDQPNPAQTTGDQSGPPRSMTPNQPNPAQPNPALPTPGQPNAGMMDQRHPRTQTPARRNRSGQSPSGMM